jgi:Flp pilus assembly pilin Flp
MSRLRKAIERHFALFSRRGVSAAEFGLIAALVAIAVIAAVMLLGDLTLS